MSRKKSKVPIAIGATAIIILGGARAYRTDSDTVKYEQTTESISYVEEVGITEEEIRLEDFRTKEAATEQKVAETVILFETTSENETTVNQSATTTPSSTTEKSTSSTKEALSTTKKIESTTKKVAPTTKKETTTKKAVTTTKKKVTTTKNVVTTTKKTVPTTKKVFKTEKAVVTTKRAASTRVRVTVPDRNSYGNNMVWIPTNGGRKYHRNDTCSNMIDPRYVTKEEAIELGFTPCKKCY